MDARDEPVVIVDSTGQAGLIEAGRLVAEGVDVVLVCAEEQAAEAGRLPEGPGRLALLVDDGRDRRDAIAAAIELAKEMFPRAVSPRLHQSPPEAGRSD